MDAHKLQLKLFVSADSVAAIDVETFVTVYHRWIRDRVLSEMVIDVASYTHVPDGPGVVLIGHAGDYFLDEGDGRLGLLYNRKRGAVEPEQRLTDLARR